jgi:hypothetical protein
MDGRRGFEVDVKGFKGWFTQETRPHEMKYNAT